MHNKEEKDGKIMLKIRSYYTLILLLIIIFFKNSFIENESYASEFETIIEGAKTGDTLIKSGQGSLTFEFTRIDSLSERYLAYRRKLKGRIVSRSGHITDVRADNTEGPKFSNINHKKADIFFAFDGIKMRCNEKYWEPYTNPKYVNRQYAYNGEKTDLLLQYSNNEKKLIRRAGAIRTKNIIRVESYDPVYYGLYIKGVPIAKFLSGNVTYIKNEIIDGLNCNVFRGKIVDEQETYTVWLAQDLLYRPKRIEIESKDKILNDKIIFVIINNFKKYSNGIFFPRQIIKERYYIDNSTSKRMLSQRTTLNVHDDYQLNIELNKDLFKIDFPKDIMVQDSRI